MLFQRDPKFQLILKDLAQQLIVLDKNLKKRKLYNK